MKYIRTKDNIYELTNEKISVGSVVYYYVKGKHTPISSKDIIKQADNIEELCDEGICISKDGLKPKPYILSKILNSYFEDFSAIYGCIWIEGEKGEPILKSVAKINSKGELELL